MSTADSILIGVKLQSVGENIATWGDPNLNNDLTILGKAAHGWSDVTITGDTTVSETNYSTSNETEVACIKLTGSPSAAFNYVIPSRKRRLVIWNLTGQTATIKHSASTGFALPTGGKAIAASNGSEVYNNSPTFIGTTFVSSNQGDIANVAYVDTAIANASTPASAGTVLISGSDTTAGYVGTKIVEGTGIDLTDSGAGNSTLTVAVDTTELEEFQALTGKITGTLSSGTTAMTARRRYRISSTATGTLPTLAAGDFVIVEFTVGAGVVGTVGRNSQTIDGASADDTYTGTGSTGPVIRYDYVSAGVVTSRLIEGIPV